MKLRELTRQPARPILVRCPVGRNGPRIGISYDSSCHRSFTSVHRSFEYHSPLPPLTHSIVEPPVWTTRWAPDRHHGILIRSSTHVIVRAKENVADCDPSSSVRHVVTSLQENLISPFPAPCDAEFQGPLPEGSSMRCEATRACMIRPTNL